MAATTLRSVVNSRWLVLVAAIWVQSCAGIGYVFGNYSPIIKSEFGYNQKQISGLGVAKDMGDSVGLFAGLLCDVLPIWALFLLGAAQNLVGYGWLWLMLTGRAGPLPFWGICILIFIGTNGETYFNTAALVACVRNFPKSRGPIVGILKGFTGLSGAIFTVLYTAMYAPDQAAFVYMVAVGPALVAVLFAPVIRPVGDPAVMAGHDPVEDSNFSFIYGVCLALAAYLMGVMLLQDLVTVAEAVSVVFALLLLALLLLPLVTAIRAVASQEEESADSGSLAAALLPPESKAGEESSRRGYEVHIHHQHAAAEFSELEDAHERKPEDEQERLRRIERSYNRLLQAISEGAVKVRRRKPGPHRGEDFTLMEALRKADFWLLFFGLWCGAGSGLTAIDNLGQMGQAQGYPNAHIFVSMISIFNFLGRIGGGYISERLVQKYASPRSVVLAAAQTVMAVGHLLFAFAFSGSLYAGCLLVGLGYGAHWSIVPATASELFGLRNFGTIYNFITVAMPLGSLLFSGVIAGRIYDYEAEKQSGGYMVAEDTLQCHGAVCFRLTFLLMTAVCLVGVLLNLVLISRTRPVYQAIYGKRPAPANKKPVQHIVVQQP